MKAKNKLLTLLILSASAAVTTAAINKAIQVSAISKNLLAEPESTLFQMASWQCSLYKRRNWKTASADSRPGYYIIRS